jgi:Mg2+-importing ATPase
MSGMNTGSDLSGMKIESVFERLQTLEKGLNDAEAKARLIKNGPNRPVAKKEKSIIVQVLLRFFNPLVMVLLIIASFSLFFGEKISALLVILMALMSVFLSFIQEYRAGKEAEKLSEMVRASATVIRGGKQKDV